LPSRALASDEADLAPLRVLLLLEPKPALKV
jgi:hypothetical protein